MYLCRYNQLKPLARINFIYVEYTGVETKTYYMSTDDENGDY